MEAKAKKPTKYLYGWKLYVNYGGGWEYELFEETFAGMRENRKAYRENCPQYPQKWVSGREANPDYVAPTATMAEQPVTDGAHKHVAYEDYIGGL